MLSDEVISVVIDIGSLFVRAGFSGEDAPRYHSTSKVGQSVGSMDVEDTNKKLHFGDEGLHKRRDNLEIHDTVYNGQINYDNYSALLDHCYKQLHVEPKDYSLLLANNMVNRGEREKVCEMLFEHTGVPNIFTIRNCVLSAFSAGRSTALVLDIGAYQSTAIAVHEGYGMTKTSSTYNIGGETLTKLYQRDLQINQKIEHISLRYQIAIDAEGKKHTVEYPNTHHSFQNYHLQELLRDFKETTIMVPDPQAQTIPQSQQYELPDGQRIEISAKSINDISETLFGLNVDLLQGVVQPNVGSYKGLQHMILEVLNASSTDLKSQLCNTILTTGGSSGIPGLLPRLYNQLFNLAPPMCKVKLVQYPSQQNRQHSVFIGGSILSSLSSFQSMWVTKQEYAEVGYAIIDRKCPM